jgi:PmbA protein
MQEPVDTDAVLSAFDAALEKHDADALELCLLGRSAEYTRFAGDRIHQPQDVTETQYLVRAVVDGQAGRAAVSVLRDLPRAVELAASAARHTAQALGAGTVSLAAPAAPVPDLPVWYDDAVAFDAAERSAIARDTMAQAAAAGAEAAGMLGRAVTQQVVATSTGVRLSTIASETSASATVSVGDGSSHWLDVDRSASRLDARGAMAATLDTAARTRGPVALPHGEYTVVLAPEAVGELLQFLPALGFGGDLAASGIGLCATGAGTQVAAELVSVWDDAGADIGLPIGFDIEGTPKRRVPFLDAGVVGLPVTNLTTARALGTPSTGHAHIAREEVPGPVAANIVMANGTASEAELIAGVDDGVYLQRFWYTRLVDPVRGTITGVTRDACFRIRNGELAEPISGMRFTQSVLQILANVDCLGAVRRSVPTMNVWNGVASGPALRSHGFRLGSPQEPA